ncbi:MAG: hypothetical protein ACRYFS_11510 [Janthinobacterium lividum]
MNISRRSFLARAAGLLSALSSLDLLTIQAEEAGASVSPAGPVMLPPIALRGYGTLSGTFRPLHAEQSSLTHIVCDSPQKAHLVQAKYLSDLGLLPGTHEGTLSVEGRAIPLCRTSERGGIACFVHGTDVLIFAGNSDEHLGDMVTAALPQAFAAADFQSRVSVPLWLDRWDKFGVMSYYGPGQTPPNAPNSGADYDYDTDLQFAKNNGPLGLVLWTTPLNVDTAEGMGNEQTWSYVLDRAKQTGVPVHINLSNSWPIVWLSNRYRDETQIKAPQFLGGFYGVAHDSAPLGPLTWSSQAGEDALLGVLQETVRRFVDEPNVVGWLEPHAETSDTPQGAFTEYGPVADRSQREFLQERYGSLAAVSRRWHGDPNHFQSWNDIHAPETAEFAGFGPDAIDLRGTWRVKYALKPDGHAYTLSDQWAIPSPPPTAPVPPEWYQPDFDDSRWDEFTAPGNDRMLTIPRNPLIYRREISVPAGWLASKPQVTLCLWDMFSRDKDEVVVYVNGQKIVGQTRGGSVTHWVIFDVTKALHAGSNHLALNIPRGIICYRAYLTGVKPAQYPDLGPHMNARWADYIDWYLWCRKAQMARGIEMIRQVDPDRSINLMAVAYVAPFKSLAQEYGCRFHDTGAMAGFWTDEPSVMMAGLRFPTSAEPGSPAPDAAQFQAFFGRWITEGVNGVHYFQTLGDIQWNPEALKTFEANRKMYELIGKYHVPFAEVGVLYSTVSQQLAGFPWDTDRLGHGGYYSGENAAMALLDYCPRAGLSEADFDTATAAGYRMIVDTDTRVMSRKLLEGIEAYVRNGGVFVTNGQTGRHDDVYPDTWPISKLTGYHVSDENVWSKNLSAVPAPGQKVFSGPEWATPRRSGGQSLKKAAADCQDLLLWTDGTVAAGMRPLGKGWIVHAGLTGSNPPPIRQIAAHFGVKPIPATYVSAPGLHFRHFIGNTGLQDIWVLFNESSSLVTTALTFQPGVHPASLTDLLTGEAREITRAETGDAVSGINLHPWQTVMYVSPCADVSASPLEWLDLQRGWWAGTKKPPIKRLPRPTEMQRFTLDLRDGWAYKRIDGLTDAQAAALAQPAADDHAWERRTLDLWRDEGAPKPQRIMLRRSFTVPAHWNAGTVLFCSQIPGGVFVSSARSFVNGKPIRGDWQGNGPYDDALGGILKPGTTHHLAYDIRSPTSLIGVRCPCFLTYEPDPLARQDLSGEWQGYADEMRTAGPIQLPGVAKNMRFVSRSVIVSKVHEGRNVVVYARTNTGEMILGLLVNGRRLNPATVGYERHDLILDVTPMVRFGAENMIEFAFNSTPEGTGIVTAEIRYYAKGVYP